MLNQVVLVGRLTKNVEIEEKGDKKLANITLAIPRSYKNSDGEYESDFIDCVLWQAVAEDTAEYCHKGDIVGVKGRLQSSSYEKENGDKIFKTEVIAEKLTFLSSRKEKEGE